MRLTQPSDFEFRLTRSFDAPRELVFRAWTEAKHLKRWFGCTSGLTKCDVDLSVAGGYRYTMAAAPGQPAGTVFGVYREIVIAERLVYTQGFVNDCLLSPNALVTVTFDEKDGQTTLTSTVWHNSRADRDMHLSAGVDKGAAASFDKLEQHLATMA